MNCKKDFLTGANPYLPLWEHIPDGEPRVFEYNGEKRVYIYGSHELNNSDYCGNDYVVWSAPIEDLTDWTYHGVSYQSSDGSLMWAPDVVQKGDTYYLYAAESCGQRIMVATSKNPAGPFLNPVLSEIGFDPSVFVDDDGRIYAYWGGFMEGSTCAELNDDMITVKPETVKQEPITKYADTWGPYDDSMVNCDGYFEASSMRKICGKYVYIYSKQYKKPQEGSGVGKDCYGYLSYKYSNHPLGDFVNGGDIILNAGEIITLANGTRKSTYPWGNNHGSLVQVMNQWYIFYHRHSGTNTRGRQAMMEPVDVAIDKDGKLFIGTITYDAGEPVSSSLVEMTSQGAMLNGIDAYKMISAGYTCHISGSDGAYVESIFEKTENLSTKIKNITSGTCIGFRYLQFGLISPKTISIDAEAFCNLTVRLRLAQYNGKIVTEIPMEKGKTTASTVLSSDVIGKQAIYFEFISEETGVIASFDKFTFDR